jgi:hypothetical protein
VGARGVELRVVRRSSLPLLALTLMLAACGGDEDSAGGLTAVVESGDESIACVELFDGQTFETTDDLSTICLDPAGTRL